jgi:hypothetical protein
MLKRICGRISEAGFRNGFPVGFPKQVLEMDFRSGGLKNILETGF